MRIALYVNGICAQDVPCIPDGEWQTATFEKGLVVHDYDHLSIMCQIPKPKLSPVSRGARAFAKWLLKVF